MQTFKFIPPLLIACLVSSGQALAGKDPSTVVETNAKKLAQQYHCFTCHAIDRKITGPAWKDVAIKYRDNTGAEDMLVTKVSKGGKGVWGNEMAMPPFAPHVKEADIRTLVKYVLSLQ